jgi:hypothetical protein
MPSSIKNALGVAAVVTAYLLAAHLDAEAQPTPHRSRSAAHPSPSTSAALAPGQGDHRAQR